MWYAHAVISLFAHHLHTYYCKDVQFVDSNLATEITDHHPIFIPYECSRESTVVHVSTISSHPSRTSAIHACVISQYIGGQHTFCGQQPVAAPQPSITSKKYLPSSLIVATSLKEVPTYRRPIPSLLLVANKRKINGSAIILLHTLQRYITP
jgi:hypothetical protein